MALGTARDDEVIFIKYDGVIKTPIPYILQKIQQPEYMAMYSDFVDFTKFENFSENKLLGLTARRIYKNIFEYIATEDFDYEETFNDIFLHSEDVYRNSKLLSIGQSIYILLQQSFTKKIYIYSDMYDNRIETDICETYKKLDCISYVFGDLRDVLSKIDLKITSFIIDDIDIIPILIDMGKVDRSSILLANYGYNYKLVNEDESPILKIENIEELGKEKMFKIAMFSIDRDLEF